MDLLYTHRIITNLQQHYISMNRDALVLMYIGMKEGKRGLFDSLVGIDRIEKISEIEYQHTQTRGKQYESIWEERDTKRK